MLDTSSLVGNISFLLVFVAGLTSFFSPCVLPLLPVYLGYLSGNDLDGKYDTKKVLINTIAFVLGISVTFFLLGLAFTNVAQFFANNKNLITKVSGIIVILFGLVQIDFIEFKIFNREKRLNTSFNKDQMNPMMAFLMGLAFSFAWTPCVGPMLSSVLLLASSAKSVVLGNALVLVYTLGFIIPFLLSGIFTTKLLNFFNKKRSIVKYVKKISGIILIIIGIMMFSGWLNTFSGYLNTPKNTAGEQTASEQTEVKNEPQETDVNSVQSSKNTDEEKTASTEETESRDNEELPEIVDFTLADQHGVEHTLSEYKGKVVFLNFWATGCPPCEKEIPHIVDLYEENTNENVVILTVVNPNGFLEKDKDHILSFIDQKGITFPVLFDDTGEIFNGYGISSIPTTFMITSDSKIFGYVGGQMDRSIMNNIIQQTLEYSDDSGSANNLQ